jgi:hypothetical protein
MLILLACAKAGAMVGVMVDARQTLMPLEPNTKNVQAHVQIRANEVCWGRPVAINPAAKPVAFRHARGDRR